MRKYYLILFGLIFLILGSCDIDDNKYLDQDEVMTYSKLLDSLNLYCPSGKSNNYFTGIINEAPMCYKDGIDGYKFKFNISSSFITNTSSIVVNDSLNSNLLYVVTFRFVPHNYCEFGKESLDIMFPYYEPDRDIIEYLDSIFAIKYHSIRSESEGWELNRSMNNFKISLILYKCNDDKGMIGYPISSMFGDQKESYMKIENIEKRENEDGFLYSVEMKINCKLYHKPQFGKEGLWGEIEDGLLHINFFIEKK